MKLAELEVGAEYGAYPDRYAMNFVDVLPDRVRVDALRVPRRTAGSSRVAPRDVGDGVRVTWITGSGPEVIEPALVAAPWHEVAAWHAAAASRAQRHEQLLARLHGCLADAGAGEARLCWQGDSIALIADQLERLLDLAETGARG